MKTVVSMPTITLTEAKAMVILTGAYFIDLRKNTKPNEHTKHSAMVPK